MAEKMTMTITLPPGRSLAEQQVINEQIVEACGESNVQCHTEMGYIPTTRLQTRDEAVLEGNIIAAVVVFAVFIGIVLRALAAAFVGKKAYRYITR
jgi:Na+/H+-dicarboxylate symporter